MTAAEQHWYDALCRFLRLAAGHDDDMYSDALVDAWLLRKKYGTRIGPLQAARLALRNVRSGRNHFDTQDGQRQCNALKRAERVGRLDWHPARTRAVPDEASDKLQLRELERIADGEQHYVMCCFLHGYTWRETSRQVGISLNTVAKCLHDLREDWQAQFGS